MSGMTTPSEQPQQEYKVQFKLDGFAYVEASNEDEACEQLVRGFMEWTGFGLDVNNIDVDGAEVEPA